MPVVTLLPTGDESRGGTLVRSSGTADWSLLDDNDAGTNHIRFDSDGFVAMTYQAMPTAAGINSVRVTGYYRSVGAHDTQVGRLFVKISGTKYYSDSFNLVVSAWSGTISFVWLKNPATGAAWTNVEVNALIAGFDMSGFTVNSVECSYVPADIDYVAPPAQVDISRHIGTFALHTLRNPEQVIRMGGNLDLLGTDSSPLELLGEAQLWHSAGPIASGAGWENEITKRRAVSPHVITENPDDYSVDVEFKDMREAKCLVWFPAYSSMNSGAIENGIPRMSVPGSTFTFTRATNETFTDPMGDSVTVAPNVPGYADGGLLIQPGTRAYFSNNTGARTWNAVQGGVEGEFYFLGALAENRWIVNCAHDANNAAAVYYLNSDGKLKFTINVGGVSVTISSLSTLSTARWYHFGVYWTGVNLENGHAAYTMALYLDRVLQATGTAAGVMAEVGTSYFDIGSSSGAATLRGLIRKVRSLQWVPTPTEMERPI